MHDSSQAPSPLQIAAHPHNNSVVILVHGIMSGRYGAWESAIDLIQALHRDGARTTRFSSYDFYAFGYPSGYLLQPPIRDSFQRLRDFIADPRYDSVVLIGHSQGGVLVKLFVIEELLNGRGRDMKVDLVFTLDSPHSPS